MTAGSSRVLEGHGAGVTAAAVSGTGALVASGSWGRRVRLWDATSEVCRAVLEGHALGLLRRR